MVILIIFDHTIVLPTDLLGFVLGCIVGHSIKQDGIGFPHFSPLCYWYIVGGEEVALQYLTVNDVGSGCCELISKVRINYINNYANIMYVHFTYHLLDTFTVANGHV